MIELAVDLVACLDGVVAHLAGLGTLEFDLMLGAKRFDHRIEALTGPRNELAKAIDGDPILAFAEAEIGTLKLLTLGLRL
jgi:hypothetical protein